MSVGVNPPRTPVTKGSSGIAVASIPNPCKMPGPPAPFIVTPLPNIGTSDNSPSGYSTTVTIEGNPVAIHGATFNSKGDVASQGTGGGLVSSNVQGPTSFVAPGSLDVSIEGKAVQLLGDQMLSNCAAGGSPPNSACASGVAQMNFMKGAQFPEPGNGIDCADHCKPPTRAEGGEGWDDCELAQLCAKVKSLNESGAKGEFEATPGANKKPAYKNTKTRYKKNFTVGAAPENSALFEDWVKDQFYDDCAYEKWKNGDPPCKSKRDLKPSEKPTDAAGDPTGPEAFNPDHVQDAALGGSLEALWNLKWLDSSVNKAIGGMMAAYKPEKHGKIVLDESCKCDG